MADVLGWIICIGAVAYLIVFFIVVNALISVERKQAEEGKHDG